MKPANFGIDFQVLKVKLKLEPNRKRLEDLKTLKQIFL